MSKEDQIPQPPEPPKLQRGVNLSMGQRIGLPLLVLLPVLAVFGVFGVTSDKISGSGEAFELTAEYTSRTRLRAPHQLLIEVRNTSSAPLEAVTITIDREYVDSFSSVTFVPEPDEITPDEYRVELGAIPVSTGRSISVDMTPAGYWMHRAKVTASAEGEEPVEVEISTFVFP